MLRNWWNEVCIDAADWCVGKAWQWRLAILIFCAYFAIRPMVTDPLAPTDLATGAIKALTLAIHEAGHVIFRFAGDYICAAGGTINQLVVPILLAYSFYRQRDYFAIAFAGAWLAFSLTDVAIYINDASAMALPLTSLGDPDKAEHDWHYMLGVKGLLHYDTTIAAYVHGASIVVLIASLALGAWCLYRMAVGRVEVIEIVETPTPAVVSPPASSVPVDASMSTAIVADDGDVDLLPLQPL